jgi:hypothetical protein
MPPLFLRRFSSVPRTNYNALAQRRPIMPLTAAQVLDTYFLETRAKLLEIAANLDRVDRAADAAVIKNDPRNTFIHASLKILLADAPDRAEKIQRLYSKE